MILRRIAAVSLGVALSVLSLLVIAWWLRFDIAERLIRSQLDAEELRVVSFTVAEVEPGALVLRDVSIALAGEPADLEISQIDVSFSLGRLWMGRVEAAKFTRVRVRARQGEAGLDLGALEAWREPAPGDRAAPSFAITPIDFDAFSSQRLEVEDAVVQIATPNGPARIELRQLEMAREGDRVPVRFDVSASGPIALGLDAQQTDARHEEGDGEEGRQAPGGIVTRWVEGRMSFDGALESRSGAGELEIDVEISSRATPAEPGEEPERLARLHARGRLERDLGLLRFEPERCMRGELSSAWLDERIVLSKPLVFCLESATSPAMQLSIAQEGAVALSTDLDVRPIVVSGTFERGAEALRFDAELPRMRVRLDEQRLDDPFVIDLVTDGGRIHVPLYEFEARGIALEGELSLAGPGFDGSLRVARIENLVRPKDYPKLSAVGRIVHAGDGRHDFTLRFADPSEALRIHVRGHHDIAEAVGAATLEVEPLVFAQGGLQPARLVPSLKGVYEAVEGAIEVAGAFRWGRSGRVNGGEGGNEVAGEVEIVIAGLGFESEAALVEGLDGRLVFVGPFPFYTQEPQRFQVARLATGLELEAGVIEFTLEPDGRIVLEQMEWSFAGGLIWGSGRFNPLAETHSLALDVGDVRLDALLSMLALEGVEGSGELEGTLPVFYEGGVLEIRGGVLESTVDGGRLRYRPDVSAGVVISQDEQISTLVDVLRNFEYEVLSVEVNGNVLKDVEIALQLRGANPDFQSGTPIEFNLKVEAAFADLLRGGMRAYSLPEMISEKVGAAGR